MKPNAPGEGQCKMEFSLKYILDPGLCGSQGPEQRQEGKQLLKLTLLEPQLLRTIGGNTLFFFFLTS